MKTISLTQPWATLVAIGAKAIETRSWRTSYRGWIAIHASKGFPREAREAALEDAFRLALIAGEKRSLTLLPRGMVIAVAKIVSCRPIGSGTGYFDQRNATEKELAFGDYTPGRFAWVLSDVHSLGTPVLATGALGLWEWEPSAEARAIIDGRA